MSGDQRAITDRLRIQCKKVEAVPSGVNHIILDGGTKFSKQVFDWEAGRAVVLRGKHIFPLDFEVRFGYHLISEMQLMAWQQISGG